MLPSGQLQTIGLLLTLFCGIGAFVAAVLPSLMPQMQSSAHLSELFRLFLFVFSIGAVAFLYKALG